MSCPSGESQQRLITDNLKMLADAMREFWVSDIPFFVRQATSTPLDQYKILWTHSAVNLCLKVMAAEYLLSQQDKAVS